MFVWTVIGHWGVVWWEQVYTLCRHGATIANGVVRVPQDAVLAQKVTHSHQWL